MKCAEPIIYFFRCGSARQICGVVHLAVGATGAASFGWTFLRFVASGKAGYTDDFSRTELPCFFDATGGTSFLRIVGLNGLFAWGERHKNNAWPRVLLLVPILVLGGILLIGMGHQFSRRYDNADIHLVLLYQHTRAGGVSG